MFGSASSLGSLVLELNANANGYLGVFRTVEATTNSTMGNVVNTIKNAGLVAAASMTAIGAVSVREFAKFESSFAGVKKTVNATEEEFAQLEAGFRDMAKEIPVNVNEINRIGEAAGQLGIKTANIVEFSRVMADLGVSTNMTSEIAATQLARLANITQMSQKEFDRLGSSLVALGNTMATTESEITEMAMRIAGAGHQVGMSEADILGFAAALSSVGVEAAAGGSSISRIMISMSKAVAEGGEKLELFSAVARQTTEDFTKQFKDDAAGAIISFIEGLKATSDAGNDVFKVLNRLDIDDIRLTDALLRAAGAGNLFEKAITTANKGWEDNVALTNEANRRYATFESQLTITMNLVRDLAITVGGELAPVLKELNTQLQGVLKGFGDAEGGATSFASFLTGTLIRALAYTMDVFYGWQLVMGYLQMAMVALMGAFKYGSLVIQTAVLTASTIVESVFRGWQLIFATVIGGIKVGFSEFAVWAKQKAIEVARMLNEILPKEKYDSAWFDRAQHDLNEWKDTLVRVKTEMANGIAASQDNANLSALQAAANELRVFHNEVAAGTDEFTMANQKVLEEIEALLLSGRPSQRIITEMNKLVEATKKAGDGVKDVAASVEAALNSFFGPLDAAQGKLDVLNGVLLEMKDVIKQPWEAALPSLTKYKKLLDEGRVSQYEFNAAVRALGFTQDLSTPMADSLNQMLDVERRIKAMEERGVSVNPFEKQSAFNNLVAGSSPFINPEGTTVTGAQLASPITGGGSQMLMEQQMLKQNLEYQMNLIQEYYENRKQLELGSTTEIENEKQRILKEMQENHATLQLHYTAQVAQGMVQVFQSSFTQLTDFAKTVAGEQSGIYKVMFFMSRAAAAAMAAVNAFLAYSQALAYIPPPYNIPVAKFALASGLAASAAILGTAIASFDGGGQVAPGPRSGGVDGKGGKYAVVHPNEKIGLDSQLRTNNPQGVVINIHNNTDGSVETKRSDDGKTVDVIISKAVKAVANDIRTGGGPVTAALETTYRMGRGRS
jgi:TP901 family phage tail tape measure protein